MFTKLFVLDATERAIATFAQTLVAVVSVSVAAGQGFESIQWIPVISASLLAAFLSVLKSIVASTSGNSASLTVNNVTKKETN